MVCPMLRAVDGAGLGWLVEYSPGLNQRPHSPGARLHCWYGWKAAALPELPEIEHLKRSLEPTLLGATVVRVQLRRRDIVHAFDLSGERRIRSTHLLAGTRIDLLMRHGKNLVIAGENGRILCIHLGMSGQLRLVPRGSRVDLRTHVHCVWHLQAAGEADRLVFRDPRRFGGIWTFPSLEALKDYRFASLGPDALTITTIQLRLRLRHSHRSIKAALLDQSFLAGVGNIYADESLFAARIHPLSTCCAIPPNRVAQLAGAIRKVMRRAISAGGSSIQSYLDGRGRRGSYANAHHVYGRRGKPCVNCGHVLQRITISQRTTVFCGACQRIYRQTKSRDCV